MQHNILLTLHCSIVILLTNQRMMVLLESIILIVWFFKGLNQKSKLCLFLWNEFLKLTFLHSKKNYFWVTFHLIRFNHFLFTFSFLSSVFLLTVDYLLERCWFLHSCQMYSHKFWIVLLKMVHSFNMLENEWVSTKKLGW